MKPNKKSKSAKTPTGDKVEMSVCGTGKQRVINVSPLLLTPVSASKLYNGKQKEQFEIHRKRRSKPNFPVFSGNDSSFLLQNENTRSADASPSLASQSSFDRSHVFHSRQLSANPSIADSEISLSSNFTTDDISSIADSEVTDVSEFSSYIGSSSVLNSLETPRNRNFHSTAVEQQIGLNSSDLNVMLTNQEKVKDNQPKSPDDNSGRGHKNHINLALVEGTEGLNKNSLHTPQRDGLKIPTKLDISSGTKPIRERIIEISPSLLLPVTSMSALTSNKGPEDSITESVDTNKNESEITLLESDSSAINDTTPLASPPSDNLKSANTSQSNETSVAEIVASKDGDAIHHLGNENSIDIQPLQDECKSLRQSLKLADADIAILVSSKQQLQLKYHEEKEEKKSLSKNLLALEEKFRDSEAKYDQLEKILKEKEEALMAEIAENQHEVEKLKEKNDAALHTLDVTRAERDTARSEAKNIALSAETHNMKIKQLENELQNVTSANIKLETMLQEASVKGEGNESYINHLKQEKSDSVRQLQELVQENKLLQIQNKSQESKIVDLNEENKDLAEKLNKMGTRFRESEQENGNLSSRLKTASKEKTELNSAVARLRSDLSKVEASFLRLKQQMIEKSRQAESEAVKREKLENEMKEITRRAAEMNEKNTEMRIRDKNVQIEQLLTKSKSFAVEKSKFEKKVSELEAHISANEKSWVQAVEREKHSSKLLAEKETFCDQLSKKNEELLQNIKLQESKAENLSTSVQNRESQLSISNEKLRKAEASIEKLSEENNSLSAMMEKIRKQLHDEEQRSQMEIKYQKDDNTRLKDDIVQLTSQVETLQRKVLTQEEELRSFENSDRREHESDAIHQMELLSELQSARRQLSHEKESLLEENRKLKSNLDILTEKITHLNKEMEKGEAMEKDRIEKLLKEHDLEKEEMKGIIMDKDKILKADEKSKQHLDEEMLMIKDHNNVLSQQLGALQVHNGKLSEDLSLKIKEMEDFEEQLRHTQEEREILKQELSSVTLQLSETLQANEVLKESGNLSDRENLIKERDLLKDAVFRQQQYTASLQKHYEKWAKDAGTRMKEEISKIRVAAEEERSRLVQEKLDQAELIALMEGKIKNVVLKPNKLQDESKDSSTQTEHENEPLIPWSQEYDESLLLKEEVKALKHEVNEETSKALFNERNNSDIDVEEIVKERDLLKDAVLKQQQYATSLQQHYEKWARDAGSKMKEEISKVRMIAEEEKSRLQKENEEYVMCVSELEEKLKAFTDSSTIKSFEASTQTSHEEDPVHDPDGKIRHHCDENNKFDSSTQTEHEEESIIPWMKDSEKLQQEISETRILAEKEKSRITQENLNLTEIISTLEKKITDLTSRETYKDANTQTSHVEIPLKFVSNIYSTTDNTALLENSSTQTDHNEDLIVPWAQDNERLKEEIFKLQSHAKEEKSQLLQENMEKAEKINYLEKTICELLSNTNKINNSTQTDHDDEQMSVKQVLSHLTVKSSTQTSHEAEPIVPWAKETSEKWKQEISASRRIADEEKQRLLEENSNQAKLISKLEEKLKKTYTTSHVSTDVGVQTSHAEETSMLVEINQSRSESILLEDVSTQTDHDQEPISPSYEVSEDKMKEEVSSLMSIIQEERDEKCQILLQMSNQSKEIHALKEKINDFSCRTFDNKGTQTKHEDEYLDAVPETDVVKLIEDTATQTDHNDEPIVPWSQSYDNKVKEEITELRQLAEEEKSRLLQENLTQSGVIAKLEKKILDLSSSRLLSDAATQTSHSEHPLSPIREDNTKKPQFSTFTLEKSDSSTQTSHDLEPLPLQGTGESTRLKEELEKVQEELISACFQLNKTRTRNQMLEDALEKSKTDSNQNLMEAGTQTSHDNVPLSWTNESAELLTIETVDSSSQTEHHLETVSPLGWTGHNISTKGFHIPAENFEINSKSKLEDHGLPAVSENLAPTQRRHLSVEVQTDSNVQNENGEEICPTFGYTVNNKDMTDTQPPSPMTILKTMESKKLKAYKKTVHLLKKKLQEAENRISDLEAEVESLKSSLNLPVDLQLESNDRKGMDEESLEDNLSSSKQELLEQNNKAMEEIKQLQHEIYEVKKSSALQSEDSRRRALAERKKSEAKLSNMAERLSALTEANQSLRDSVDKLQVKLSERTKSNDLAQREKQRYQLRARRLQASLRSLAWISGKQDKLPEGEKDADVPEEEDSQEFEDSLNSESNPVLDESASGDNQRKTPRRSLDRSVLSLPASVIEIEESLKDLQSEIIALERQMQEHNSAVKKSKSQWSKLKEESNRDLMLQMPSPQQENLTSDASPAPDRISEISQVI